MTVYNESLKPHSRIEELLMVDDTIENVEDISDECESPVVIAVTTQTTEWRLKSLHSDGSLTEAPPVMIDVTTGESYETHGQYVPEKILSVYRTVVDAKCSN